jgi:6-phosphogluconate dehydrogenase
VQRGTAPCCTYIGPNGAGHYVKMVHNGIEYGDMQLICEAYAALKFVLNMQPDELHQTFAEWNRGELESYLIEITADIFSRTDPQTGNPLVDMILDKAGQKGTGKWTIQSAIELGVPISTIYSAVEGRLLSSMKDERLAASRIIGPPPDAPYEGDRQEFIDAVRDALYASKIVSYAQGMNLLRVASNEFDWSLSLGEIATIWRGGCIIRARFLDRITEAYGRDSTLISLMLDPFFTNALQTTLPNWRKVVSESAIRGLVVPAFSASLAYLDSYRTARVQHNLLQAQRDYFGAHTYERVDEPGTFHTDWIGTEEGETPDSTPAVPPATP